MTRFLDNLLERLKKWEAKYYHDEYVRMREDYQALLGDPKQVRALPVVNRSEVRSVLVFKPDEIGDAVYSLPALKLLRQALPEARIALICQKKTAPLFERSGLVDEIATIEVKTVLRKFHRFNMKEALAKLTVREFDVGIFLRSYPGYFKQFLKLPARIKIHPRDPRMKSSSPIQPFVSLWVANRQHQAVQMCEIVHPLTQARPKREEIVFPEMIFTDQDKTALRQLFPARKPESYIVVHPFADFETRHYVYWGELIRWMKDRFRVPIVVIGGKQDRTLPVNPEVIQAQGKLSLGQTAYLISQANVFIGNLSGPVHLAGALGRSNVTMMSGHSAPAEWTPFGDALVMRADVGCAPCHLRTCNKYKLVCVRSMNPLKVMPHLEAYISSRLERKAPRKGDAPTEILFS